jgi:hypothetical protein
LYLSQEQAFRPVPQRVNFLVEQAGKPVHKKLIENGATSQVNRSQRAASIGFELNSRLAMFSVLVAQPTRCSRCAADTLHSCSFFFRKEKLLFCRHSVTFIYMTWIKANSAITSVG